VDAVFVSRQAVSAQHGGKGKGGGSECGVSFSGLLNAIDGIAAQEGRIFYMTTNHIERLDPALIRPGRCDVKLELKKASKSQIELMFLRFYPGEVALAAEFRARLPEYELSMATLQGYFLNDSRTAAQTVAQCGRLLLSQAEDKKRPPPVPVYDTLARVGLERYAPVLEAAGLHSTADVAASGLAVPDDLCALPHAHDLCFDGEAKRLLKFLFGASGGGGGGESGGSDAEFWRDEFALVEASAIRDAFLAAYPTDSVVAEGEAVIQPLAATSSSPFGSHTSASARHAFASASPNLAMFEPEAEHETAWAKANEQGQIALSKMASSPFNADFGGIRLGGADSIVSDGLAPTHSSAFPFALTLQRSSTDHAMREGKTIDRLSREFCAALCSTDGRGCVSGHALRRLLAAYPQRPSQCVRAAPLFRAVGAPGAAATRSVESQIAPRATSLFQFLHRAGLGHRLRAFTHASCKKNRVSSVIELQRKLKCLPSQLPIKIDAEDMADEIEDAFNQLDRCEAEKLASVLCHTRAGLASFALPQRSQIHSLVFLCWAEQRLECIRRVNEGDASAALPLVDDGMEKTSSSFGVPPPISVLVSSSGMGDQSANAGKPPATTDVHALQMSRRSEADLLALAFKFAESCTDARGQSAVSVFAIRWHLDQPDHINRPDAAIASVRALLLEPIPPSPPPPSPPPPPPAEWVHWWLADTLLGGSEALANSCAELCTAQHMASREDWLLAGAPFGLDMLRDEFKIESVGRRMRIREMHTHLLANPTVVVTGWPVVVAAAEVS
jgi:hypothetical protein